MVCPLWTTREVLSMTRLITMSPQGLRFAFNAAKALAVLAMCLCGLGLVVPPGAHAERTAQNYHTRFTNPTGGLHLKDTNVWVYTTAFARRFGMPTEWIDDTLKGAAAVAYRVEWESMQQCGFFSDPNNCRPIESCVLDVYLSDADSGKLPWKNDYPQGFISFTSAHFLVPQDPRDSSSWDRKKGRTDLYRRRPGLDSLSWVSGPTREGKIFSASSDGAHMRAYDREQIPGLDFLQLSVDCNFPTQKEKVRLFFQEKYPTETDYGYRYVGQALRASAEDEARFREVKQRWFNKKFAGNVPHTVSFPDAYMKRVNAYDKKVYEPKSLATEAEKRLLDKDSKPKPTEERRWWNKLFDSGE